MNEKFVYSYFPSRPSSVFYKAALLQLDFVGKKINLGRTETESKLIENKCLFM